MNIFLGPIYGRSLEPSHVQCLMKLLLKRYEGVQIRLAPAVNDALVCRARSKTATEFLMGTEDDVHVSVDGDIMFDADSLVEIARQALDTGGIVAGQYVTRSKSVCRPTSIQEVESTIEYAGDPTLVPIRWAATGFMATPRAVFQKLSEDLPLCHESEDWRFYPFYQPFPYRMEDGTWIYLSEDYALCERAKQAGFKLFMNPSIRLLHLGLHPFRLEDMLDKEPEQMAVTITRMKDGRHQIEASATELVAV
ncbi:MAG: hypothetical protein ACRDGM_18090 [bacterium]